MRYGISKLGTQIRLPDGREATVVYNSLIGVGIKFGLHNPNPKDFENTDGNTVQDKTPENFKWEPDALLRKPEMSEKLGIPCICDDDGVKIIRYGLGENTNELQNTL